MTTTKTTVPSSQSARPRALSELLRGVTIEGLAGTPKLSQDELLSLLASEVRDDSRQVAAGDLFIALPGQSVDGHRFVQVAAERGAVAAVVERAQDIAIPQIVVGSTAQALSLIAANRYGRPAEALTLVAVTGTNGKTTTTHLIEALINATERTAEGTAQRGRAGVIGTIAYRFAGKRWPAPLTTPTAPLLQQTLAEMRELGATHVVMEASSHALSLGRLHGVRFRVAAFTNLSQDHLDFHGDMESYFQAKLRLFHDHLLPASDGGRAVVLVDDEAGVRIADSLPEGACLRVSLSGPADISLRTEKQSLEGTVATFQTPVGELTIQSRLTGRFNLANLAVAVGVGLALGLSPARISAGLSQVEGVPGRLERLASPRSSSTGTATAASGPSVFIDYAHTPDALARVLSSLRTLSGGEKRRGRLFVVFGCGGDRDAGKRPQMGQIAASEADLVVVTSDNPRSEDPQAIIRMIVGGITGETLSGGRTLDRVERSALTSAKLGYFVEPDRRAAIATAIAAARAEDVVLIAGKGHEDYQIIGSQRQHLDDREEALRALLSRLETPPRSSPPPSSPGLGVGGGSTVASSIELPLDRVLSATAGRLVRGGAYRFSAVTIDSRAVIPGALFVAVRGHKQDGHQFCAQAVSAGAAGLLVDRGRAPRLPDSQSVAVIEVADTHVALGQLARAHREAPEIAAKLRVVGVTGSSGKTSTKELVAAILTTHAGDPAEVLKTEGNLNNHFGVPLTLLRLRPGQRFAVIEMGMSARGEIAYLTSLARPDVGIITNVGSAHLEMLGSLDGIAAAKGELFVGLGDGCTAVFCGNPDHARVGKQALWAGATLTPTQRSGRLRAFVTRRDEGNDPSPTSAEPSPVLAYRVLSQSAEGIEVELRYIGGDSLAAIGPSRVVASIPLVGVHQADNAALAAAAAMALDVPLLLCAHGLSRVVQAKHRGQIVTLHGRHVLDDCYNANPDSTAAALRTLAALSGSARAVAVLGDMLELGNDELALHRQIGEVAASCRLAQLITVGERAKQASLAAQAAGLAAVHADSPQQAASLAAAATQPGDWILVKGSRGMALEHVIDSLRSQPPAGPSHSPGSPAAASTRPADPKHGGAS